MNRYFEIFANVFHLPTALLLVKMDVRMKLANCKSQSEKIRSVSSRMDRERRLLPDVVMIFLCRFVFLGNVGIAEI